MDGGKTEGHGYPQAFVCTFCKQEFALISSVFSHMSDMHYIDNKNE